MNKAIRILENMTLDDRERIVMALGEIPENAVVTVWEKKQLN